MTWNRCNWFKYSILISEDLDHFHPANSIFDEPDFSWRDFAHEFIPLLGNWLKVTQKNEAPTSLKDIFSCLKELHKTCDSMYDDIQTLLLIPVFLQL